MYSDFEQLLDFFLKKITDLEKDLAAEKEQHKLAVQKFYEYREAVIDNKADRYE